MQTMRRMKIPVLVIAQGAGPWILDALLGHRCSPRSSHSPAPGFSIRSSRPTSGWLGVFLTGSDTASNASSAARSASRRSNSNLNPILIVATNSTGGVMGKMIDAQSIMVACAACYDDPKERSFALGPIFPHCVLSSAIGGAAVIGAIAMLQAYVFPE